MLDVFKSFSIIATIYACVFWAIAVSIKASKRYSPQLFAFLILAFSVFVFVMMYAKLHNHFDFYSQFLPLHGFFTLSLFPLFYLYIHTLTMHARGFQPRHLLHFLFPFIFGLLSFVILHIWMNQQERYLFASQVLFGKQQEGIQFQLALATYQAGKLIYVVLSVLYSWQIYRIYTTHKRKSAELFSNDTSSNLSWLKTLSILFSFLFAAHLAIQIPSNRYVSENNLLVGISYLAFTIFYFSLGYFSFRQRQLYLPFAVQYDGHHKKGERLNIKSITNYFEINKPYLDPDYSLFDMCAFFDTNRTYLSSIINQEFQKNFRSLVNHYRIKEAQKLIKKSLQTPAPISLEYVAHQSGFNSYTSFARVFKEISAHSPSEYREHLSNTKAHNRPFPPGGFSGNEQQDSPEPKHRH